MAKLQSNAPFTAEKPTLLHTCSASARSNDALWTIFYNNSEVAEYLLSVGGLN
jgi:hypothetical protein